MNEKFIRILGTIFVLLSGINLQFIFSILVFTSYKPDLIEFIPWAIFSVLIVITIIYFLFEIVLMMVDYKRFEDKPLIERNNFYALIIGCLFTFVILFILILNPKFFTLHYTFSQ